MTILSDDTLPLKSRIAIKEAQIKALRLCKGNELKIQLKEAELEILRDDARALNESPRGSEPRHREAA